MVHIRQKDIELGGECQLRHCVHHPWVLTMNDRYTMIAKAASCSPLVWKDAFFRQLWFMCTTDNARKKWNNLQNPISGDEHKTFLFVYSLFRHWQFQVDDVFRDWWMFGTFFSKQWQDKTTCIKRDSLAHGFGPFSSPQKNLSIKGICIAVLTDRTRNGSNPYDANESRLICSYASNMVQAIK
jgi:hypothetical protein